MDNAKPNSVNKTNQSLIKTEVTERSNSLECSIEDSLPTNDLLAKKLKKFSKPESSHYISQCSVKSMGLMEILKLKSILNYKDLRSVINWCIKNEVFIIQQGNKQFVNQWEFVLSFYKPFIKHLKIKHKNWKEMFLNYLNGELGQLLASPIKKEQIIGSTSYKPKTRREISFLDKIKKI
jgi:hypothetical protein